MRGMRGWSFVLFAVPAVVVALGIQYLMRRHYPEMSNPELAMVMKPSQFHADSGGNTLEDRNHPLSRRIGAADAERDARHKAKLQGETEVQLADDKDERGPEIAKNTLTEEEASDDELAENGVAVGGPAAERKAPAVSEAEKKKKMAAADVPAVKTFSGAPKRAPASEEEAVEDTGAGAKVAAPVAKAAVAPVAPVAHAPVAAAPEPVVASRGGAGSCQSIEYRGEGPTRTKISKAEWARVITQFHAVKDDLLDWLDKHRKEFPDKLAEAMDQQVKRLKIQRPPATEEPDVAWRGIGVWTTNTHNEGVLRMGSGFVKLVVKQPSRARFELARLVAQSWAPCELERLGAGDAWAPLLKCLDVKDDNACGNGSYSEAGWAVSSALAAAVAPPGCTVPAFQPVATAACVKKIPLPLTITSVEPDAPAVLAARAQDRNEGSSR
jgi:hypothetical protein